MAEEDEGMEAFDFDERDLEFALNPGRRHFQTKNQATYGGVRPPLLSPSLNHLRESRFICCKFECFVVNQCPFRYLG